MMTSLLFPFLNVTIAVTISALFTAGDIGMARIFLVPIALFTMFGAALFLSRKREVNTAIHVMPNVLALAVIALLCITPAIFEARFLLSKAQLEKVAKSYQAGESVALPLQAGMFRIENAGVKSDGSVYLWTDANPAGPRGLVYDYRNSGYNLWTKRQLNTRWHFIAED